MEKRGQLTVFVIVAVLVIAGVVSVYYFFNRSSSDDSNYFSQPGVKEKIDGIFSSIKSCREISADDSVARIGFQGGYNKHPKDYLDLGWTFVPYYFFEGDLTVPDKAIIEKELADSFDNEFYSCINSIPTGDFHLTSDDPKTTVQLSNEILFDTDMKFVIGGFGKEQSYNLNNEPLSRDYKLYSMYEVAKFISDSHKNSSLCVNCLVDFASERDLYVDFVNFDPDTRMVILTPALNDSIESYDYSFQFMEKYQPTQINLAPKIPENEL